MESVVSFQAVDGCVGGSSAEDVIAGVTKDAMVTPSGLEGLLLAGAG